MWGPGGRGGRYRKARPPVQTTILQLTPPDFAGSSSGPHSNVNDNLFHRCVSTVPRGLQTATLMAAHSARVRSAPAREDSVDAAAFRPTREGALVRFGTRIGAAVRHVESHAAQLQCVAMRTALRRVCAEKPVHPWSSTSVMTP